MTVRPVAHSLSRRHPVSSRARQRHPDDGDVPCARHSRARRRARRAARHARAGARSVSPSTAWRRSSGSRSRRAPVTGPAAARRIGYLSFAIGRVAGAGRADVVFTRDLGVASLLLRLPRALRPPVVYESHGYAPDVAAALPQLSQPPRRPRRRKLRRLARREARVWRAPTAMSRSPGASPRISRPALRCAAAAQRRAGRPSATGSAGARRGSRCAGPTRRASSRQLQIVAAAAVRSSPMPGICIRGRASTCCSKRSPCCRTSTG